MGNEVFANGNEIACKSGDDKVIAAFPDVCLSPPSPPAGPIPIPYPNTSFSKDMKKGSKSVKIDGKEIMLKDQSFYKSSPLGNEAATKSFGAGVISHVITGKTYFVAWSMDVKFEGKNVVRHLDLSTSNHASPMANAQLPLPGLEGVAQSNADYCKRIHAEKDQICGSIQKVIVPKNPKKYLENKSEAQRAKLCGNIDKRIKGQDDCLAARQRVTDDCFGGVTDDVHADQEAAVGRGRARAITARQEFCEGQLYMGSPTGKKW